MKTRPSWATAACELRARTLGHKNKVLGLAFGLCKDGREMTQVGFKHVTFWTLIGRHIEYRRGQIGARGELQAFVCVAYVGAGDVPVVGTADGHLYVFNEERELAKSVKAHDSFVYALHAFPGGICSGGKDGMVKLWTAELEASSAFDQAEKGPIRSVCVSPDASRVLVGTHGALFEISIVDGSELHGELLFVDPVEATMLLLPHDAADVDGRHGECAQQQRAIMVFASAVRGVATQ